MNTTLKIYSIAPSSPFSPNDYEKGVHILQSHGYEVMKPALLREHSFAYLNGSDGERLAELQNALSSSECDVLWAARGGYGLTRILPSLTLPASHHVPLVVGISDTSALLLHLWAQRRIKGVHATHITKLKDEPPETLKALTSILKGHAQQIQYPTFKNFTARSSSSIEGELIACNLCMLTHLIGTSSMPSLENTILILEEVGEKPYRIDRMLTHLWASRSLVGVKAVIVGHLTQCHDQKNSSPDALDVFIERTSAFGIPLYGQLPLGHESPNWPIPFGANAQIIHRGDKAQLQILEEVVRRD